MINALRLSYRSIVLGLTMVAACTVTMPSAGAGWGHRWGWGWGVHSPWGLPTVYAGWGAPCWSHTSLYVGVPRYRLYPSYRVGWYAPAVTYYAPVYYYAPTYYLPTYASPVVYPTVRINPCVTYVDPCVQYDWNSISSEPTLPTYSTGITPAPLRSNQQMAGSTGSMVDRLLATHNGGGSLIGPLVGAPATNTDSFVASPARASGLVSRKPVLVSQSDSLPSMSNVRDVDNARDIPEVLLNTADAMFATGGYRQAAEAYAQLSVRYGDHDALVVRRFIALIASGDHNQAAVVYELAQAKGQRLNQSTLPLSSLAALYGSQVANQAAHVDSLARFAINSQDDPVALAMVGTWLELDNQVARAEPFRKRAAQLMADFVQNTTETKPSTTLAWVTGK